MTDAEKRIREALAAGPTPGPWYLRTNRHPTTDGRAWGWLDTQPPGGSQYAPPGLQITWERGSKSEVNARFVAACSPTNIAAILAHVEAQEAEVKRLTAECDDLRRAVRHEADCVEAAKAEIERLTAALQYEQHRAGRQGTHGDGCADWGPEHYECAIRERDDLRRQLAEAEMDAERYRWLRGDSCPDHSSRWTQWEVRCWKAPSWTGDLRRADLDDAIDAAIRHLRAQADAQPTPAAPQAEPKRELTADERDVLDSALRSSVRVVARGVAEPKREPVSDSRPCTCHPDDNPPVPCAQKYALSECRAASEPTEAQIKARDALLDFISENGTASEGVQHYLDRYVRAALAAKE